MRGRWRRSRRGDGGICEWDGRGMGGGWGSKEGGVVEGWEIRGAVSGGLDT